MLPRIRFDCGARPVKGAKPCVSGQAVYWAGFVYDELGRQISRTDLSGVTSVTACTGTQRGITTWTWGSTIGASSFGQVVGDSAPFADGIGAGHITCHSYTYDGLGRNRQVTTVACRIGARRSRMESMAANLRETLHMLAEQLPEDADIDDVIERLRFLRAVEEGKRAAGRGEFASDEEVRRVFTKYGVKA